MTRALFLLNVMSCAWFVAILSATGSPWAAALSVASAFMALALLADEYL